MNYHTWNKITMPRIRELIEKLRAEELTRQLSNDEVLGYYLSWYSEEGGKLDQAIEFIGGTDNEWKDWAKNFSSLQSVTDYTFYDPDSEFVQAGARLLKDADPDCYGKALRQKLVIERRCVNTIGSI